MTLASSHGSFARSLDFAPWHRGAGLIVLVFITVLGAIGMWTGEALAARVGGVLTSYGNTTPLMSRDLHFQNNVTGDIYLSPTHENGAFAAMLPPGDYSLRTESGAVLLHSIKVERRAVDLGEVSEVAPYAPQRLWHHQAIAPSLLTSPAPSTAYVATADTTPMPADAAAVPKPQVNWNQAPTGPATKTNAATGTTTAAVPSRPVAPGIGPGLPAGGPNGMNGAAPAAPGQSQFYNQPPGTAVPVQ